MSPEIRPQRLHPLSPLASTGLAMIRAWPVVLLSVARSSWGVLIIFVGALVIWRVAVWSRTIWSLDDAGLVLRSGILRRQVQTVPPQRVQQIEIRRGLRHRMLGLAVVRVGLAGSGEENQVELDALLSSEAVHLERVLERWRTSHLAVWPAPTGTPLATLPPPAITPDTGIVGTNAPALFVVRTWHLIAAGLSSRTLWLAPLAAVGGALQLFGDLGRGEEAQTTLRDWLTSTELVVTVPLFVAAAVVLAVSSHLVRNHRFQVRRQRDEFVITRGLIEQRSVSVPKTRVQALQLTSNVVRVALGLATLQIHTADLGQRGSASVEIPIGSRRELLALGDQILEHPVSTISAVRHPFAAVRREVIRRSIRLIPLAVILVIALGGLAATTRDRLLLAAAVAGTIAAVTGVLAGLQRATGWNEKAILTRSGFFSRTQWIVPITRIQSVGTLQNPFQRRLGLITVRLDVAGTRSGVVIRDISVAEATVLQTTLEASALQISRQK
jgi:putative membrane protein